MGFDLRPAGKPRKFGSRWTSEKVRNRHFSFGARSAENYLEIQEEEREPCR